ncbi:hypothetical protein, partial [Methanomethylovorans sp.]|uniref:hypothetical protein n=1 Tax=Methanomethylovorans sp. TaxID=2758717 RepID=UPI00351C9EAF
PETSGLNGTFEQLGNSIGVALVGTIMLSTLLIGLQMNIEESAEIPQEYKPELLAAVEESVELVSNTQLKSTLEASGADPELQAEVLNIYALSRVQAFKIGIVFLIFLALVGLVSTVGLSDRKL